VQFPWSSYGKSEAWVRTLVIIWYILWTNRHHDRFFSKQLGIFLQYHSTSTLTRRTSGWRQGSFKHRNILFRVQWRKDMSLIRYCFSYCYYALFLTVFIYFYVLLTVHLTILILVINQLDAQNLFQNKFYFMPLHVSSTMCSSSGGQNCITQPLVSSHL